MRNSRRGLFRSSRFEAGVGLVELLIAVGIMSVLILIVSEFFSNMFKGVRAVDVKTQSQDLGAVLRMSMAKPESCSGIMELTKIPNPTEFNLSDYDAAIVSGGTDFILPIPELTTGGVIYKAGTEYGDLKLVDLSLKIGKPTVAVGSPLAPSYENIVTLSIPLKIKRGQSPGISQYLVRLPMRVTVERDTVNNKARIVGCNSETPVGDPHVVCTDLGGRWLDGVYMPKARCNMSSDILLAINELPDGIPDQGGANANGERIESCFYQRPADSRILEYICANSWGLRKGPRCSYDKIKHQWGVNYFNASGLPYRLMMNCAQGVKVSLHTPDTGFLQVDDPLYLAYQDTPPADWDPGMAFSLADQDHLDSVTQCQNLPDIETYVKCNNAGDNGRLGVKGSCVYVTGIRIAGAGYITRINTYNKENGTSLNPNSYTGWINVLVPRAFLYTKYGTVKNTFISEATGQPCFRVQTGLADDSGLLGPPAQPLASDVIADPSLVGQCVAQAKARETVSPLVPGAPAMREETFSCDNSDVTADSLGLGDLNAQQCWFMKGVSLNTMGTTYDGWVFLQKDLPAGKFNFNTDSQLAPTAGKPIVYGIPCNVGVRLLAP